MNKRISAFRRIILTQLKIECTGSVNYWTALSLLFRCIVNHVYEQKKPKVPK